MIQHPPHDERQTILVVDDEKDIVVALGDLFDEDYRVLATTSPREALAMLDGGAEVAVIISDQRMPEMTGDAFLAEARGRTDAEAMLLTGYADLEAVVSAINRGRIVGYAHKPWEPEALRTMVAAAAERHRLKRALAFERAIFAGLAAHSADRISVLDGEGRVVRANREPAGKGDARDAEVLAGGGAADDDEQRTDAQGSSQWLRVQRIPFAGADAVPHLLRIESDQTARRLLEQRLHQSEKLQALGTLAGGIAHDFNNLLTAVLGNLELAGRRTDDPALGRFIANASEAARRGTTLTQRLLSFSRQRDLAASAIAPNALVRGLEELIVRTTGGVVTLAFELAEDAWCTRADADQLELALLNLCINARDAMAGGGRIVLGTANRTIEGGEEAAVPPGDYVAIRVTDAGAGMAPDVQARVFEPFFTTKEPGKGTGLGLPMVYAMARTAGGGVTIDSVVGHGTTVTILLPRTDEAPACEAGAAEAGEDVATPLDVLLVEDDAEVRAVTGAYLAELGHRHVSVPSGDAALATLRGDAAFHVLITDYAMPGMTGVDLARQAAQVRPLLATVLVTGFAEQSELPEHVVVLAKPFTRDALAHALGEAQARVEAIAG